MANLPFFYQDADLKSGTTLALTEETAKHIVQVLRKKEGDRFILNNGNGLSAESTIVSADKKRCTVHLDTVSEHQKPAFGLHLCVAFTKNASRNEWLLEKATELGVRSITPLISARTEREKFRTDRARNILISAMMQSQQYFLPELNEPSTMVQILANHKETNQKYIAHCDNNFERQAINEILKPKKDTVILIGPEGDFTPEEIEQFTQNGFAGITLCEQRLRTETAAMAVCAYFNLMNHD